MFSSDFTSGKATELVYYDAEKHGDALVSWYFDFRYRFFFREWAEVADAERVKRMDADLRRGGIRLCTVLDKKSGQPIGLMTYASLKPKAGVYIFGIMLDEACQRKVYAIDAIIVLADFIFKKLFCRKLVVEFWDGDQQIHRISSLGGFVQEAVLKDEVFMDGKYLNEARYALYLDRYEELYGDYLEKEGEFKPGMKIGNIT